MRTFSDIIDRWPEPAPVTFADDIGEEPGTCRQWRNRDTLPSRVWRKTIAAAARRKIEGVTYELLASIAEGQQVGQVQSSTNPAKGERAGADAPALKRRRPDTGRAPPRRTSRAA